MIFKILILVVILTAVYFIFFKKPSTVQDKEKKQKESDTMVECKSCQTYISNKEAIIKDGKYYCSKECAYK